MHDTTDADDRRAKHAHFIAMLTDEVYDLLAFSPLTRAEIITLLGNVKDRIADLPLLNAD